MSRDKQIEEMWKVMQKSNAVTYEPNAHRVDLYAKGQKEKFYVSEQDGHLTIDYGILAKALYDADYRKTSDIAREIFEEIDELLTPVGYQLKTINLSKYIKLKKKYTEESEGEE